MKKRWISIFVENEIGVLARISGLFSSKSYNLDSLAVGPTQDQTVSRMTISLYSDDQLFEQIMKQLNRTIEVIKVIDITDAPIHIKEIMFLKLLHCSQQDQRELFRLAQVYHFKIIDYNKSTLLLESIQNEAENNKLIRIFRDRFPNRFEVVRGGSVAMPLPV
jgi:acetolactate synthase-1/3 small subunit